MYLSTLIALLQDAPAPASDSQQVSEPARQRVSNLESGDLAREIRNFWNWLNCSNSLDIKGLLFKGDNFWIERGVEPLVDKLDHLIAWPSAQSVEEFFRHLAPVLCYGICPGVEMKRHGVGQSAIAVKDVSGVPFFRRSKYCHSENRG